MMMFTSGYFYLFLCFIFILYWLIDDKYKWHIVLCGSYCFYLVNSFKYFLLLILITLISFYISEILLNVDEKKRMPILALGILLIILPLFLFKFFSLTIETFNSVFKTNYIIYNFLLPLGISFYSFEAISYMCDTSKGKTACINHHLGYYAAYLAFFPTVSSGPIERAENFIPQLTSRKQFAYENGINGVNLIGKGLIKKVCIADNLAILVNKVFENPIDFSGCALLLAFLLYPLQIYYDFSGYSDIVRGIAKLFGIEINMNFNLPYFSSSIREFWSRWHISLSSWLRDYIYIPLGGNRKGRIRKYINLIVTFLISGVWHGASINYIVWGLMHGMLQVVEDIFNIKSIKNKRSISWLIRVCGLYLILCVTWLFFRIENINDAIFILGHLFDGLLPFSIFVEHGLDSLGLNPLSLFNLVLELLLLFSIELYELLGLSRYYVKMPKYLKLSVYILLSMLYIYLIPVENSSVFLYFKY